MVHLCHISWRGTGEIPSLPPPSLLPSGRKRPRIRRSRYNLPRLRGVRREVNELKPEIAQARSQAGISFQQKGKQG